MDSKIFEKYIEYEQNIDGWFELGCLDLFRVIDLSQKYIGIHGHIGEIGLFCGRSFIPLCLLRRIGEKAVGVDCFEHQFYNESHSGYKPGCNRVELVWEHIDNVVESRVNIDIIVSTSITLTDSIYTDLVGGDFFRIWHIDGGHSFREASHDIIACWACTVENGGVLIIDDAFNKEWPEVNRAMNLFFNCSEAVPIAYGYNKAVVCRKKFRNALTQKMHELNESHRNITWFDNPVLFYGK